MVVREPGIDFPSFYFAARGFLERGNIYDVEYLNGLAFQASFLDHVYPYLYPPVLAFYLTPLIRFGLSGAAVLWVLISSALGVLAMLASTRLSLSRPNGIVENKHVLPLLSLFAFIALPFDSDLKLGQVNSAVLVFISMSLLQGLVYNRHFLSGLLLAPAVLVKVTPAGLLLFFVLNKRPKVLYGCAAGLLIFSVPTLTGNGLTLWAHFMDSLDVVGYGKTIPGLFPLADLAIFSVAGCVARITANAAIVGPLTLAILAILGCGLLVQHYRLHKRGVSAESLLLPYLILMIIGAPVCYVHHVVYIYPGLLLTCWMLLRRGGLYRMILLICTMGLTVIAGVNFPQHYDRLGTLPLVLKSLNLYALLGLFVIGLIAPDASDSAERPLADHRI